MPIETILKRVSLSSDFAIQRSEDDETPYFDGTPETWVELLRWKTSPELILDMLENGQKRPVCIQMSPLRSWELFNGHHRLAAAILLGWDTIDVVGWRDMDDSYGPTPIQEESVDITRDPDQPDADLFLSMYNDLSDSLARTRN